MSNNVKNFRGRVRERRKKRKNWKNWRKPVTDAVGIEVGRDM